MANFILGMNGVAYVSATPCTDATPAAMATAIVAGTIVSNIKDLKSNLSTDKVDITTRAGSGWKQTAATLKDGAITFQMVWKTGDTAIGIFKTAWINNAEILFAAVDGPVATSGNSGPAGNFTVTNFSRDESVAGAMLLDIELSASSVNSWFVKP